MTPRRAFALIELLVTMAIIAVLVGLIMPAVQMVRWESLRAKDANNLHQIGLALQHYESIDRAFPQNNVVVNGAPVSAWVKLLPFLEAENEFEPFQYNNKMEGLWWFDPLFAGIGPKVFQSPLVGSDFPGQCDYALCAGTTQPAVSDILYLQFLFGWQSSGFNAPPNGFASIAFPGPAACRPRTISDIVDGTSHTIAVVSTLGGRPSGKWIKDTAPLGPLGPEPKSALAATVPNPIYGTISVYFAAARKSTDRYEKGPVRMGTALDANMAFADGSVHWIARTIDPKVLKALATRAGFEPLEDRDY